MLRFFVAGTLAAVVAAGVTGGQGMRRAVAQAPVPATAMRGQNATPKPPAPSPEVAMRNDLARLHHTAQREVQLGDLAAIGGQASSVRSYGAQLAARFRAFDELILGAAAARDVSEARLAASFAGDDLEGARRAAAALSRLGAVHGSAFDTSFWASLSEEQSAAADVSGALGGGARDPAVRELATQLSVELDEASRDAVGAARAKSASAASASQRVPAQAPAAPTTEPAATDTER